jgi:hypothetical protein
MKAENELDSSELLNNVGELKIILHCQVVDVIVMKTVLPRLNCTHGFSDSKYPGAVLFNCS